MKTDREMTESLLKRRDEYDREKMRRTANLRLIPKIGVPVCAALAVVTVISFGGGLFTERDNGKDINLAVSASGTPLLTEAGDDQNRKKDIDIYSAVGYTASELLSLDEENIYGITVQKDAEIPRKIVFDNVIYNSMDYYIASVDENENSGVLFYPAGTVTFETRRTDSEEPCFLSCTAFDMENAEEMTAIVINGQINLYNKERSGRFNIDGVIYDAQVFMEDFGRYRASDRLVGANGFSEAYYAEERSTGEVLRDTFTVFNSGDGYICFGSTRQPDAENTLSTDGYEKVLDISDYILKYFLNVSYDNFYGLCGNKETDGEISEIVYQGRSFLKCEYESDSDIMLHQLRNVYINKNNYTLFEVDGRGDILAIINGSKFEFFTLKESDVWYNYNVSVEPIEMDQLKTIVADLQEGLFDQEKLESENCIHFYDDGYNTQFCYNGENGENYVFIIGYDDPNSNTAQRLTVVDTDSGSRIYMSLDSDKINDYFIWDGDRLIIEFNRWKMAISDIVDSLQE